MGVFDIDVFELELVSIVDERLFPVPCDIGGENGSFFRR
jgi:hypothetical protein